MNADKTNNNIQMKATPTPTLALMARNSFSFPMKKRAHCFLSLLWVLSAFIGVHRRLIRF